MTCQRHRRLCQHALALKDPSIREMRSTSTIHNTHFPMAEVVELIYHSLGDALLYYNKCVRYSGVEVD